MKPVIVMPKSSAHDEPDSVIAKLRPRAIPSAASTAAMTSNEDAVCEIPECDRNAAMAYLRLRRQNRASYHEAEKHMTANSALSPPWRPAGLCSRKRRITDRCRRAPLHLINLRPAPIRPWPATTRLHRYSALMQSAGPFITRRTRQNREDIIKYRGKISRVWRQRRRRDSKCRLRSGSGNRPARTG